jgi:hypothetical protein
MQVEVDARKICTSYAREWTMVFLVLSKKAIGTGEVIPVGLRKLNAPIRAPGSDVQQLV